MRPTICCRMGLGVILALCLSATPSPSQAHDFDEPLRLFTDDKLFNETEQLAVGDVNGDGLDDIVTLHRTQASPDVAISGRIGITLQRRGGGFDFPRFHACNCIPDQVKLFNLDDDPGLEIVYQSIVDDYYLPKGGFEVLDVPSRDQLVATRYVDAFLYREAFSLVDVNQDGHDDLFYTYFDDDNTTPGIEYSYAIWYHTTTSLSGRVRHGFQRYKSARFTYSGINDPMRSGDPNYTGTPPVRQAVDLDADGYIDAIEGKCATLCLFRQEPFRQLVTAPITTDDTGRMSRMDDRYGDLDGDGRPDRVSVVQGFEGEQDLRVELQSAENAFSFAGSVGPLYAPGTIEIADFDNNGLSDFVFLSEHERYADQGWLRAFLQETPGNFVLEQKQMATESENASLFAGDFNADGCRDLLVLVRKYGQLEAALSYLRGRGCLPASDLQVRAGYAGGAAWAEAKHVAGLAESQARVLRVDIAPALSNEAGLELQVQAPTDCSELPARAPRRLFDCAIPVLQRDAATLLSFPIQTAAGRSTELQVTAFLLTPAGDTKDSNNRHQARALHVQPAAIP